MRLCWRRALCAAALLAAAAARRPDQDFEFDDDAAPEEVSDNSVDGDVAAPDARRPRRYVYDPHSPLCRALRCKKRELCLLRDARTALCAARRDVLRRGDAIVARGGEPDDVLDEPAAPPDPAPDRCVGCGGGGGDGFLCGSDNRTYSSLCRLDLHNCVRRPAPAVTLACRGFCPCARAACGAGAALADRLLDWFAVLMERARAAPPPRGGFPPGCKPEVRWMFAHLDQDGDRLLSAAELYALRHDERERCLRPFLSACARRGRGRGHGGHISRGAWCACLGAAARPCVALARAHAGSAARGGYSPACDARGFYRARQCHAALGVCWCVDAHGAELPGSRARGARPCPPASPSPRTSPSSPAALAPPADDEDGAGSGDDQPRY